MDRPKKKSKVKGNKGVITSFKAYKKKYFPKKYAEEERLNIRPLKYKQQ